MGVEEFVVARNPDADSSLPFLVRLPLQSGPVVLKVRETWPRTSKVYCHPSEDWPADPSIIERIPVRSCVRRGAAIDLVLDRGRENRSQFVFAKAKGRQVVFWQSARTRKQARPDVSLPTARAFGVAALEIIVDSHERYPWKFSHQQLTTTRRALAAGDYAVERDGQILASVERKSLADLVATITGGRLWYLLATWRRSTGPRSSSRTGTPRYSSLTASGLWSSPTPWPRPPSATDGADRVLRDPPAGPGMDLPLPQRRRSRTPPHRRRRELAEQLPGARHDLPRPEPTTAMVRAWARTNGLDVSERGRLRPEIWAAYRHAHPAGVPQRPSG